MESGHLFPATLFSMAALSKAVHEGLHSSIHVEISWPRIYMTFII